MKLRDRTCHCLLLACAALVPSVASAHGEPPAALSLATPGDSGLPLVVRLTEGLALRDGERFRYLCPALWGDDDMGPAVGFSGGPTLVGASSGLFVLDAAGRVSPHPDPQAGGHTISLREGGERLWQLRLEGDRSVVMEMSPSELSRRFADSPPWSSVTAGQDQLQLLRLTGSGSLEQLMLSHEGEELSRQVVALPEGSVAAFGRIAGGRPYVVLLTRGGLASELGRVQDGAFVSLHQATGVIAGPVELPGGERFVAVAGDLARFDDEQVEPLDEPVVVTCLSRRGERAYACADGGLRELRPSGLGARWFELAQMAAPPPDSIPAEAAERCELQWQRFQLDLSSIGVALEAPPDGGPSPQDGDNSRADGGPGEAGVESAMRRTDGGCGVKQTGQPVLIWPLLLLVLVGLLLARRYPKSESCSSESEPGAKNGRNGQRGAEFVVETGNPSCSSVTK